MMEVFVLVERKAGIVKKILCTILGLLLAYCVLGMFVGATAVYMSLGSIIGCILWFVVRTCKEYEYSYFDGEVRFTKIKNKSRRKKIGVYNMDETLMIAPSGDRSVSNYENGSKIKVRNLTSGRKDAKVYVMVTKGANGQELIRFEPDEKILDAISRKYAQKVRR